MILFSRSLLQKEKESLNEELYELKKENKLLKETNALVNRKKEHYECEIKRLNKVPGRVTWGGPVRGLAETPGAALAARGSGRGPHTGPSVIL